MAEEAKKKSFLLCCKREGCLYHDAVRLTVEGETLEEAIRQLKSRGGKEGYVKIAELCVKGKKHQWELSTPDPS